MRLALRSPVAAGPERPAATARAGQPPLKRRIAAEALGSFFLFACVIGSGIMAERLAGGNQAIALLANSVATGAMLFVLIAVLEPISGAHLNPMVSLVAAYRRELRGADMLTYILAQFLFGLFGTLAAHLMFGLPLFELSTKMRSGFGQWAGEAVASFGLILTIIGTMRLPRAWTPASVALFITAAYWFTSSTSFANPAITVARSLTNSFAGIAPSDVPLFISAQLFGGGLAAFAGHLLFDPQQQSDPHQLVQFERGD
jgi:glycerol uptake facilitator-like aquaporin